MPAREARVTVEVSGLDDLIRSFRALGKVGFGAVGALERILAEQFAITQGQVHVISGDLKRSGHTASDFDGKSWTGSIIYGGRKGTPAYYAIYEMRRHGVKGPQTPGTGHGTPHDFYSAVRGLDHLYEEAIARHIEEHF